MPAKPIPPLKAPDPKKIVPMTPLKPEAPAPYSNAQRQIWNFIVQAESPKLSLDPNDRGNWTSGIIGIGELKGSKYGVSAAAFPHVDIASMTYDGAFDICMQHYWPAMNGDEIAAASQALAMVMIDTAWNSGPKEAIELLQKALRVADDGDFGPLTRGALTYALAHPSPYQLPSGEAGLLAEYAAERLLYDASLGNWERNAGGWTHRIMRLHGLVQAFLPPLTERTMS
jgi:lysozyme family protein